MRATKFDPTKRTPQEKERDLAFIARYYLRGYSLADITDKINDERVYSLGYEAVRKDLALIYERWRDSYLVDFNQVKATELARLDKLERAYWEGWAKSILDKEDTLQETKKDVMGVGQAQTYSRQRAEKRTSKRDGNVSFLKGVERVITLRLKVFGLIAQRTHITTMDWKKEAIDAGIPESQLNKEFEALVSTFNSALGNGNGQSGARGSEEAPA